MVTALFVAKKEEFDLNCGLGMGSALKRPRRSIHSLARSNPLNIRKQPEP